MRIVNQAYLWRQGNSGNGFVRKSTDRYKDRAECSMDIPHTIVGTLDGTVICSGKGLVDRAADSVDIGPLAVDPAHQGMGFGKMLLDCLENLASHQELSTISCRPDLLNYYRRRGYVTTKTVPITDIIPLENLTRPDLRMHLMRKKINKLDSH